MRQGWEIKTLSEISEIVNGGTPDTTVQKFWDGDNLGLLPRIWGEWKVFILTILLEK